MKPRHTEGGSRRTPEAKKQASEDAGEAESGLNRDWLKPLILDRLTEFLSRKEQGDTFVTTVLLYNWISGAKNPANVYWLLKQIGGFEFFEGQAVVQSSVNPKMVKILDKKVAEAGIARLREELAKKAKK